MGPDSDEEDAERSLRRCADEIAAELTLRRGIPFSPFVADRRFIERRKGYALVEAFVEEGITVARRLP